VMGGKRSNSGEYQSTNYENFVSLQRRSL
jgi:hypothetical protein